MPLPGLLARLVATCSRRAGIVFTTGVLVAVLGGLLAVTRLGVTTDTDTLFSASLPWKQRQAAFSRDFPQFQDLLVCVIDAAAPEEADATAAALASALGRQPTVFHSVQRPDDSPYFRREGLLFLDRKPLEDLLNRTIAAQPFLGQLVADPSARGLFAALSLVAMGVRSGQADVASFAPVLRGFHLTLASAAAGHPTPLSWQTLLGGGLASKAGRYRFVLVQPKLNYGAIQPGGRASDAIRAAAAQLPFVRAGLAHVRITGSVALADEEFASVEHGMVGGLIASLLLVTLWLFLAARSWRMVVPIALTLIVGLLATTGFAALAVGTLNLISIAFAILFVGIAVDFAIQFNVRFREMREGEPAIERALAETGRRAGVQILIAAAATAAGFLAFTPTDFAGVAQLGLIAGVGMLIAFASTLTFLPAALTLFRPPVETREIGLAWARPLDAPIARARVGILLAAGAIALAGLVLLPRLRFDSDPLHTKNPDTEAMLTLRDLGRDPLTDPYTSDILRPGLAQAAALVPRLQALPLVEQVRTLDSFVPTDQAPKLAMIADAAAILGPTLAPRSPAAPVSPGDIRLAAKTALSQIESALAHVPQNNPLRGIADDLTRLTTAPDPVLLATNSTLTRFLPAQLAQLRDALTAKPVTAADVPPEIARDWVLPDGRARVQVVPKPQGAGTGGLPRFVAEVRSVAPDAGGSAVTIVQSAATILSAFRDAAIGALLVIAAILFLALRRPLIVALVLAPLLLSALLTVVIAVAVPVTLNYANIIALPLLLGVGVSFNIYFVMNWRDGQDRPLGSATARAVVFSALTTGTAFGSLALSAHPGTASMGRLLLLSLGCTLLMTLVFVPALLAALRRPTAVEAGLSEFGAAADD